MRKPELLIANFRAAFNPVAPMGSATTNIKNTVIKVFAAGSISFKKIQIEELRKGVLTNAIMEVAIENGRSPANAASIAQTMS